jgi:hypothetical protein
MSIEVNDSDGGMDSPGTHDGGGTDGTAARS